MDQNKEEFFFCDFSEIPISGKVIESGILRWIVTPSSLILHKNDENVSGSIAEISEFYFNDCSLQYVLYRELHRNRYVSTIVHYFK